MISSQIYTKVEEIPAADWLELCDDSNLSFDLRFLKAVEAARPENIDLRYALIYQYGIPAGAAVFQLIKLKPGGYRIGFSNSQGRSRLKWLTSRLQNHLPIYLVLCGNAFTNGASGIIKSTWFSQANMDMALNEVMNEIIRNKKYKGVSISLVKDLSDNEMIDLSYKGFCYGPNMTMLIHPDWRSFDDYINELRPKYKSRAQRALRKGGDIERRELRMAEMIEYRDEIYFLHQNVYKRSDFQIAKIDIDFFWNLKSNLGDDFQMTGYFINDCMIGFTTRVFYKNILEGYLHGIDYSINKRYCLYENILYDDVKAAIESRASLLNLGTTAPGMKSAVGAVPVPMKSYLKFKNHAINKVINPGEYFTTEEKVIRFPFKIKERFLDKNKNFNQGVFT